MMGMLTSDRDRAHCLVHGDSHLGNLFFEADGTPGYLDWQSPMRGVWALDVGYFMGTGMTIEDRRHSEADLRELRKAVTFAVYAEEGDLDQVTRLVEMLFSHLDKAYVGK